MRVEFKDLVLEYDENSKKEIFHQLTAVYYALNKFNFWYGAMEYLHKIGVYVGYSYLLVMNFNDS